MIMGMGIPISHIKIPGIAFSFEITNDVGAW
jgi:hypothetical protein